MTLLRTRIQRAAKEGRVPQIVVERDYAQSYVLQGLAMISDLQETLVFKGGTALKKIHFTSYRFSEDLDFSTVGAPKGDALESAIRAAMATAESALQTHGDVRLVVERYNEVDEHPGGQEAFKIRVQFPWQPTPIVPVKLEITYDEPVLCSPVDLPIIHGYDEPFAASTLTYALEEIIAEKLRASRQTLAKLAKKGWARPRARDFYDLWHLVRLERGRIDWGLVGKVLPDKCALRDVAISCVADVFDPAVIDNVRASWAKTLGDFVAALPNVDDVLNETRAGLDELLVF